MEAHVEHLRMVLQILKESQLFAKRSKCEFGKPSIKYLGHVIIATGVSTNPDKTQAIVKWPTAQNIRGVRRFLELADYHRRFIKDFGNISKPLTELLKKYQWRWDTTATVAFNRLKTLLSTTPILALPNFDIPCVRV